MLKIRTNLIVKVFDNPLGRIYLGVPKGKKIYRITNGSVHYYTGILGKDGTPLICTGEQRSGGNNIYNKIIPLFGLVLFVVSSLFKIEQLLFFFLTSSGERAAGTAAEDTSVGTGDWNADSIPNVKVDDTSYAYCMSEGKTRTNSHYLKVTNYGFSVPTGSTIDGILVRVKRKKNYINPGIKDNLCKIVKADGTFGSENKADTTNYWETTATDKNYGSSSDLWSETWSAADINDVDFGFAISADRDANTNWDNDAFVYFIGITVYYTVPSSIKTVNGLAKASVKTVNGLAIASVKTINGLS